MVNEITISQEDHEELQRLFMRRDELREDWRKLLESIRALNAREREILDKYVITANKLIPPSDH